MKPKPTQEQGGALDSGGPFGKRLSTETATATGICESFRDIRRWLGGGYAQVLKTERSKCAPATGGKAERVGED